jgi:hypothetical protein
MSTEPQPQGGEQPAWMGGAVPPTVIPPGSVAMRIRLFEVQEREMARVVSPPWPTWMQHLYALESLARHTPDPEDNETATVGAAIAALAERLSVRLGVAAFAVTAMEEIGWRAEVDEHGIVLVTEGTPREAIEALERAGVYGPLCKVCFLDAGTGLYWIGSG